MGEEIPAWNPSPNQKQMVVPIWQVAEILYGNGWDWVSFHPFLSGGDWGNPGGVRIKVGPRSNTKSAQVGHNCAKRAMAGRLRQPEEWEPLCARNDVQATKKVCARQTLRDASVKEHLALPV